MFPVLEALAAAGELSTGNVPEEPPPQANKKITLKNTKFLIYIINSPNFLISTLFILFIHYNNNKKIA